jgi:hypothetical protein
MPTIFRFFLTLVVLAAIAGAAVFYLANFVEPNTRQMTIRIPSSKLKPTPLAPMPAPSPPAPEAAATADPGAQ